MLVNILIVAAFILSIVIPFGVFLLSKKKEEKTLKRTLACNIFFFFATFTVASILLFSGNAFAAGEAKEAANSTAEGLKYIGAALSTGLACVGAGIAVSNAASAALGALSEDSSIFGKSLIFVALAEGVAIYGLVISVMILG